MSTPRQNTFLVSRSETAHEKKDGVQLPPISTRTTQGKTKRISSDSSGVILSSIPTKGNRQRRQRQNSTKIPVTIVNHPRITFSSAARRIRNARICARPSTATRLSRQVMRIKGNQIIPPQLKQFVPTMNEQVDALFKKTRSLLKQLEIITSWFSDASATTIEAFSISLTGLENLGKHIRHIKRFQNKVLEFRKILNDLKKAFDVNQGALKIQDPYLLRKLERLEIRAKNLEEASTGLTIRLEDYTALFNAGIELFLGTYFTSTLPSACECETLESIQPSQLKELALADVEHKFWLEMKPGNYVHHSITSKRLWTAYVSKLDDEDKDKFYINRSVVIPVPILQDYATSYLKWQLLGSHGKPPALE